MRFLSCFSGIEAASVAWAPLGWECVGVAEVEPFPCAVLAHHYPDVPNLGDVTADDFLQRASALRPDVLVGGPPCFVAGTLILTRTGLRPIEDVAEGDEVLTHLLRWRRVAATMRREADTFLVRGQGHHGIETTAEHPFYARQVRKEWIVGSKKAGGPCTQRVPETPGWVEAADLKGLFWSSPATMPSDVAPNDIGGPALFPRPLTPELMWVLGAWLGDGWVRITRKQANLVLCCAKYEAAAVDERLRAVGFDPSSSDERTTARFVFGDRALTEWVVDSFGRGAAKKSIPTWLLCSDEPMRRAFFEGYLHADGATVRNPKGGGTIHTFTTISKGIAVGLRLLANTLGLSCTVHFTRRPPECVIEGRTVRQSDTYQIRVYDRARSAFFDGDMVWGKVRHAAPTGRRAEVFNFEVEEDNSYVADSLIVHNCQDFSVAGLRAGLEGVRGALSMRWVEIIHAVRPAFAVTENVPGWLNLHGGKAFGAFIAGLVGHDTALIPPRGCGGRWTNAGMVAGSLGRVAWRVMDARYFGLAQRRNRVFVVFCPRDGADPAALLFERKSVRGNPQTRREAREGTTAGAVCGALPSGGTPNGHGTAGVNSQAVAAGHVIATGLAVRRLPGDERSAVANPLGAKRDGGWRGDLDNGTYAVVPLLKIGKGTSCAPNGLGIGQGGDPMVTLQAGAQHGVAVALRGREGGGTAEFGDDCALAIRASQGGGDKPHVLTVGVDLQNCAMGGDVAGTLDTTRPTRGGGQAVMAFDLAQITSATNRTSVKPGQPASTLNGSGDMHVATRAAVRRLVPEEAEALQGFPRGYTLIPYRGKHAADGPRYKALGNSFAVPCMAWIGRRIAAQDALSAAEAQRQQGEAA